MGSMVWRWCFHFFSRTSILHIPASWHGIARVYRQSIGSRLPAGGFANLQGRDGVTKGFELRRRPGGDKAFPVAHTCFNRLDLPAYSDVAVLARILSAILEGDVLGFSGD